ncbi:ATP-binding protein [Escherichia coli]|uniref:ATP-binding protein n=1 Tax=Escherichia coli TaxID=562 RepID=UPI001FCEA7EF|nr:ATP-binding protein [Escherichia coli]
MTALAHRDWTRFVEIEIGLYSNRFEVISPGALNNSMSVEKMVAGQRSPRNTIIMEVLRDYGYVDFRGMGVRTKIIPQTQAMSGQLPEFTATEDYLKTILYRSPSS